MTTEATNNSEAPKKSSTKKILAVVSLALVLIFWTNHLVWRAGYVMVGIDVNDSTIVITPVVDTTAVAPAVVAVDTTKKDTTK